MSSRPPLAPPRRRRRYLPADQRKREILDAALHEFLEHGYRASTIERIAHRAGLSKSGIYAHYTSKDGIFEELLTTTLMSTGDSFNLLLEASGSMRENIEAYVDRLYDRMEAPQALPTFQLLMTEGARNPKLVRGWGVNVLAQMSERSQHMVNDCVQRGLLRPSPMTEQVSLVIAPLVWWLAKSVLLGEDMLVSLQKMRALHKQIMLELLLPQTVS